MVPDRLRPEQGGQALSALREASGPTRKKSLVVHPSCREHVSFRLLRASSLKSNWKPQFPSRPTLSADSGAMLRAVLEMTSWTTCLEHNNHPNEIACRNLCPGFGGKQVLNE